MGTDPEIPADPAAFREFVRRHHPDRGGDPAVFAAVVSAYRARGRAAPSSPIVVGPGPVRRRVRQGLRSAATMPAAVRRRFRRRPPRVR